jgi:hypothetical protein
MKAYEIPVSKPVLKMLKRDYGYSMHMRIDRMMLPSSMAYAKYHQKYLGQTKENQVRITLVCRYASPTKLYTVARLMEHEFNTKMMLYVEACTDAGMDAAKAIQNFMDKYDISFDELKPESAYKRWHRYKAKETVKNLIPLWS